MTSILQRTVTVCQVMQCTCRYYITDGAKFGADYLLYPGDPLLFHAQFTVRCLGHHIPIKPALLAGGARGSHAARKHLLLASVGLHCMLHIDNLLWRQADTCYVSKCRKEGCSGHLFVCLS